MKKWMLLFILASLYLFDCSIGEAADWKFVGKSGDGNRSVFIDKESIRPISGNLIKAAVKLEYNRGKGVGGFRHKKIVSHAIGDEEFDCRERRTKTLQVTVHFTDGDTANGDTISWKFVIPQSILETIYDYVCTNGKK